MPNHAIKVLQAEQRKLYELLNDEENYWRNYLTDMVVKRHLARIRKQIKDINGAITMLNGSHK